MKFWENEGIAPGKKSRIANEFLPKTSQKFPIFNLEITHFLYFIQALIIDKNVQKKLGKLPQKTSHGKFPIFKFEITHFLFFIQVLIIDFF